MQIEIINDDHSCPNCYYEWFDDKAYPCSRCIHNKPSEDMFRPKLRAEQTEPKFDKDINVRSKDEPQYDAEEVAKDINRRIAMGQRLETMSCQECKYWEYIAKEWQCSVEKCQYEPQTDCSWK